MSDTITQVDKHKAIELLKEVVKETGWSYVYPSALSCRYYQLPRADDPDAKPAICIAGRLLLKLGITTGDLQRLDACKNSRFNSPQVLMLLRDRNLVFDNDAVDLIRFAQTKQDERNPWGRALEQAQDTFMSNGT